MPRPGPRHVTRAEGRVPSASVPEVLLVSDSEALRAEVKAAILDADASVRELTRGPRSYLR